MKESNGGGESTSGPQGSGQVAFSNVRYVQQIDEDDE